MSLLQRKRLAISRKEETVIVMVEGRGDCGVTETTGLSNVHRDKHVNCFTTKVG